MALKKKNIGILRLWIKENFMNSPCVKCNPKKEDCYKWSTCFKRKLWIKIYKLFGGIV